MKKFSETLSSLQFTSVLLPILILLMAMGIVLTYFKSCAGEFTLMNSMLVRRWLAAEGGFSLVKAWFVGLCLVMVFLGINLGFCTWKKIVNMKTGSKGPRLVMMIVHILFGLVALGHFGSFMLGFRHENVRMKPGESFAFQEGYQVTLTRIHFVDDPLTLKKSRRDLTREEFHYRSNFVEVELKQKGSEIRRERVFLLKPMRFRNVQVTLKKFIPPKEKNHGSRSRGKPGAVLAVTKNPVLPYFLVCYPLMILGIGVYLAMTWQGSVRTTRR